MVICFVCSKEILYVLNHVSQELFSHMIVASLPMYDWPEFRQHTDEFWCRVARHAGLSGILDRTTKFDAAWSNPNMVFSQTCGYPFTHKYNGLLHYIATPHYDCDGCEGAQYSSVIFARDEKPFEEFFAATGVINTPDSMSGMLALKLAVAPHLRGGEFFKRTRLSGGHRNSLRDVRNGFADICAIDTVCVALAKKYCPHELDGLVEITRTPMVPALPFVTRAGDVLQLQTALQKTFADADLQEVRDALLLGGCSILSPNSYDIIPNLENAMPHFEL
jgi:ABC-type phosphate/phosphonate transport system substrate-binding protein